MLGPLPPESTMILSVKVAILLSARRLGDETVSARKSHIVSKAQDSKRPDDTYDRTEMGLQVHKTQTRRGGCQRLMKTTRETDDLVR